MDARVGIVTGRRTDRNRGQGVSVRLLQCIVTDAADVQTVQLIEQMGDESNPPNGSMVVLLPGGLAFKLGVATADGIAPIMPPGGKRIYSIDPSTHTPIAQIQLAPDGAVTVINPGATITISPAGAVSIVAAGEVAITSPHTRINGPLTATGTITAPTVVGTTNVTFGGKSALAHTHGGVQTGSGTSGAPS